MGFFLAMLNTRATLAKLLGNASQPNLTKREFKRSPKRTQGNSQRTLKRRMVEKRRKESTRDLWELGKLVLQLLLGDYK